MTKLKHLGKVGLEKVLTEIPKGQATVGIQFAFKIKIAAWREGKYGYRYHLDVVVRTLDMQAVLGDLLWKVYPSFLPRDIVEAIDTDDYTDTWWLVYTENNPNSKADPPRTRLHLIDTQQGLDAHSGPPNLKSVGQHTDTPPSSVNAAALEGGQPAPGEESPPTPSTASPGTPCLHTGNIKLAITDDDQGFFCEDCGERVG